MFFYLLFFIFVFIIIFGEFFYPKIIFFLPAKPPKKSDIIPEITVLIPAYNEEQKIADKIKNTLSLKYPQNKKHVIVIDNGSVDRTYGIASRFPVTLLKSRRGKIHALNAGIDNAKTDLIAITDADVELGPGSLASAASYFGEGESVGAVSGFVVPLADKGNALMREKKIYKERDWELRYREGMVDSVCNLDGKLVVFRKSVFPGFPENALVDDYFMTFRIREKGYRLVVDKSAEVYEKLEESFREEIDQFKRYAASVLAINFRNIKFLFNPKYGYFGMLTFPFRRFFPIFYPIFLLYFAVFLVVAGASFYGFATAAFLASIVIFLLAAAIIFPRKRLALVRFFAVFVSYFSLFKKNDLKFGGWATASRKK